MTVQVCTVFTPRGAPESWAQYISLLRLQRKTAKKFGHSHLVVTDVDLTQEFSTIRVPLDPVLMRAMIDGVIKRLQMPAGGQHLLFVDADCLVGRDLHPAFDEDFDLGLTRRKDDVSPINNGAMYVPKWSAAAALSVFRDAYKRCGEHWAADQEAISQAVAPVPDESGGTEWRNGCRVRFLSMALYGAVPKRAGRRHLKEPFVIHFKGKEAKDWAEEYATRFILTP